MATRPLNEIAREIRKEWKKVNFGAVPYLEAMGTLTSVKENYHFDSGESIVIYFLANAAGFRGEAARRIKAELKSALRGG
jgi:hypothetical protein